MQAGIGREDGETVPAASGRCQRGISDRSAAEAGAFVLSPEDPDVVRALAGFYLDRRRFEDLRQMARRLLEIDP
jgi:hypothetical protein